MQQYFKILTVRVYYVHVALFYVTNHEFKFTKFSYNYYHILFQE